MDKTKELILELINHAKTENHIEYKELTSWPEFVKCKISRRTLKITISNLEHAANKLFNKYCRDINLNFSSINTLLMAKVLWQSILFYQEELSTINKMIANYSDYLWSGNFIKAILFREERN